ncbi:MAG: hypothetical protein GX181_05890 [Synergistaceae bacterium]|nr:CheR family methyltransferase [Synergistota bacterium]NLM71470.1 hypothetical protein [Synergistaceae bacterium]
MTLKPQPEAPRELEGTLDQIAVKAESRMGMARTKINRGDLWRVVQALAAREKISPGQYAGLLLRNGFSERVLRELGERITIGETYFFREPRTLSAFQELVVEDFLADEEREEIRVWCAGCSTGEEVYTIAIVLHRSLFGCAKKRISVLGTDINLPALEKARKGVYSGWSFRGVPEEDERAYFDKLEDGKWGVKPGFRRGTYFSWLNLADEEWSPWSDASPPDVIFCRNVLIYFSEERVKSTLERFHSLLPCCGWLILAPCEAYDSLSPLFTPVCHDGVTLYRKLPSHGERGDEQVPERPAVCSDGTDDPCEESVEEKPFLPAASGRPETEPSVAIEDEYSLEGCLKNARHLANIGKVGDAMDWVDRAFEIDGSSPEAFYLAGLIFSELSDERQAVSSLRRAVYLAPNFALAHYGLGGFALRAGKNEEADRHFRNAEEALSSLPYDALLWGENGVTAGELLQTVRNIRRP